MPPRLSRRRMLAGLPLFAASCKLPRRARRRAAARRKGPIAISSGNGARAVQRAVELMRKGMRPVDAAVAGVNLVEDDPRDPSVGYGGLPNADGVVELDSCVMDGPAHTAGAVAALRNIKNPSRVALKVMRRTDHVLLVGEGALRFAKMHGFTETNLLTEYARKRWLRWRERLSPDDDWVEEGGNAPAPGRERVPRRAEPERRHAGDGEHFDGEERPTGTIHLSALDAEGRLGACTSTSGLAFKIPGRVGDSPLIGCGLYLDNDVGSAGSTGRGEAVITTNGSRTVVEAMRRGLSPTDACLEACRYIAHTTRIARLLDEEGRPNFQVYFYALAADGRHGAAALRPGRYLVFDDDGLHRLDVAHLYERPPRRAKQKK